MLKKTVITSAVVSALLLSSSGIAAAVAGDKPAPAASRSSCRQILTAKLLGIQQP